MMRSFRWIFTLWLLLWLAMPVQSLAEDEPAEGEQEEEAEPDVEAYFELQPSLVSNLQKGGRYIRCDIQLKTNKGSRLNELELHSPALRHQVLMVLLDQDGKEVKTPDGKEKLRQELLKALQKVMKDKVDDELISDLYFTNYFVQ